MARMFPPELPNEIKKDFRRSAECKVYCALSDQLDDEYNVFYSSPWLGTNQDGSEIDGESDFVVAHPDLGILVIEVKGGRISIDSMGQWRSTDRNAITYRIKNPVQQAKNGKYHLLEKLKISPLWKPRWIRARHGVILPDVSREKRALRPDMPLNIFAFEENMACLEEWIKMRFAGVEQGGSGREGLLGNDGIFALVDMMTRPVQLKVKLATDIREDLQEIKLLTEDQILILNDLAANNRMAIAGAAGTGKTVLAVQKAILLAEQGRNSLLLCFNRPLSVHLRKILNEYKNIMVMNFHKFCAECLKFAGRDSIEIERIDREAGSTLTSFIIDIFSEAGVGEFDAVIIDEGQDFRDEWLEALEVILKDIKESVLYIFYDNNQNVMSRNNNYLKKLPSAKFILSRNFRNTQSIFREATNYYKGNYVRAIGPLGKDVKWHSVEDKKNLYDILKVRIGSLVNNENIFPDQIAVLFPDQSSIMEIPVRGYIGRYPTISAEERQGNHVILDTIRRFKGLESPVVFLVIKERMEKEMETLYTGLTRAQSIIEIFGPSTTIEKLKNQNEIF